MEKSEWNRIKKQILDDQYKKIGSKGGTATKKKYGSEHFRKIGKKGLEKKYHK